MKLILHYHYTKVLFVSVYILQKSYCMNLLYHFVYLHLVSLKFQIEIYLFYFILVFLLVLKVVILYIDLTLLVLGFVLLLLHNILHYNYINYILVLIM